MDILWIMYGSLGNYNSRRRSNSFRSFPSAQLSRLCAQISSQLLQGVAAQALPEALQRTAEAVDTAVVNGGKMVVNSG